MEEFKRTGLAMLVDSRGQSKVASRTVTANGDVVAINMRLYSMVDDVIDGRDTVSSPSGIVLQSLPPLSPPLTFARRWQ